jgi:hypothetical protein
MVKNNPKTAHFFDRYFAEFKCEMKTYHDLPQKEKEELLKFPAYVSLLAANYHNKGIDEDEKKSAIDFSHIKTFSSNPLLKEFFDAVNRNFEKTINDLNEKLPKKKNEREIIIRNELEKIEKILLKTDSEYSNALRESMKSFKEHVAHAHHNLMEYLLFPVPIKGLTY